MQYILRGHLFFIADINMYFYKFSHCSLEQSQSDL
jgi:hypothetical protein